MCLGGLLRAGGFDADPQAIASGLSGEANERGGLRDAGRHHRPTLRDHRRVRAQEVRQPAPLRLRA